MAFQQTECNGDRIEKFLDHGLPREEQADLERHLDVCAVCCEHLHDSAADGRWWQEASGFLKDDALDGRRPGGEVLRDRPVDEGTGELPRHLVDLLDPTDDPRMLGRFGGYEVAGIVGYGGMGIVLKGFEVSLNRYVAIKLLAPHLATLGAARERFGREARAAAAVVHEHVIAIHRVEESRDLPYLVMPYVGGSSLQKRLDRCGGLKLTEILRIGMQVASGLAAAHAQGLVHRDIKPANILLEDGVERVVITDFGLARTVDDASLTHSGIIAGTPQFMSPEQARGEAVDPRSDLFSLGSVMYTMCTGRPPFRAETPYGVLRRISESAPRPIREIAPEMPDWLRRIVAKLQAKNPADRFASAREVSELLGRWLAHVQQPTVHPAPSRLRIGSRRRTAWVAGAGVGSVMGVAAIWAGLLGVGDDVKDGHGAANRSAAESRQPEFRVPASSADELSWREQVEQIDRTATAVQHQWHVSPSPVDDWDAEIGEMNRRLDRLSEGLRAEEP